jgi:hypothetical protein
MLVTNIIIELELTKYIVTFKNNYEKLSIILNIKKKSYFLPSRRKGKLLVAFETLFYYFVN